MQFYRVCINGLSRFWRLPFTRAKMLMISLVLIASTSMLFGWVLDVPYDGSLNIALGLLLFACMPFVRGPISQSVVANILISSSLVTIFAIAWQSGGIHSIALMWPAAISLLALLLIGLRGTVFWFVITLLCLGCTYFASINGWTSESNAHVLDRHFWGVMTASVLAVLMMVGVRMHDHLHSLQVREVEASTLALEKTNEALIRIQNLRDEFVASVGHELRTPMNAILGFNGVLRSQIGSQSPMVANVDHIRDATHHLLNLVNDILEFSQLQSGHMRLHLRHCEMRQLMETVVSPWHQVATGKGLILSMQQQADAPQRVLLDDKKFKKMVDILLDNAIKFTSVGRVTLIWGQQGEQFELSVSDTGHGIEPELQARIFNRFERADLVGNQKLGGTGLGLAICEGLVKLHGGCLSVRSQEGEGSTFVMHLPLVNDPLAALEWKPETEFSTLPGDSVFRLLLVDDNPINLMVVEMQLSKVWPKIDMVSCQSASVAWQALQSGQFDLALVDMVMPEIDGLELTRRIRAHSDAMVARLPVIAFTANVESHERWRCLQAGMNDVLTKPLDEKRMLSVISGILRANHPGRWA
jgi:signal transduction histidine kinase/ActR/RegA family two-component response regulator